MSRNGKAKMRTFVDTFATVCVIKLSAVLLNQRRGICEPKRPLKNLVKLFQKGFLSGEINFWQWPGFGEHDI
jgi:hypothetical protein